MIRREIQNAGFMTALSALADMPYAHFLSGGFRAQEAWGGNWRILAAFPSETVCVRDGQVYRNEKKLTSLSAVSALDIVSEILADRQAAMESFDRGDDVPPFVSGALGHVDYEVAQYLEPVLALPGSDKASLAFGFYDAVMAWDTRTDKTFIFAYTNEAVDNLQARFFDRCEALSCQESNSGSIVSAVSADKSNSAFKKDIRHCIDQILAGEIFQANLSRELSLIVQASGQTTGLVASAYEQMVRRSAAGYSCLLQYQGKWVLSNSPERFFAVQARGKRTKVVAEPIKGTRPRDPDSARDRTLALELLTDEKDRAENTMIADLVRNDLSKVCRDGTIREDAICELQSWPHVHHLVSRISGELRPDKTPIDILKESFPCGSVTGAPKIRAMEVIAAAEKRQRGIYCGAIGYIDDRGTADFSVAIRTAEATKSISGIDFRYGTGGGITVLSDPEMELEETKVKAETFAGLRRALKTRAAK